METYLNTIRSALIDYLPEKPQDQRHILYDSMVYMLKTKSKCIRPLLVCAVSEYLNEPIEKTLALGCALEYVHTYSLIHDDLPAMDNDDWRRGQEACHIAFGEDVAILSGDCLQIYAIECLATQLIKHYDAKRIVSVIAEFSKALGLYGMAGGQHLDLFFSNCDVKPDQPVFESINQLKTGALLSLPFSLPALLLNTSKTEAQLLKKIGIHFGFLFQAADDILDVIGTKESLGKTPQKDIKQHKATVVDLLGLDQAKRYAKAQQEQCLTLIAQLKEGPSELLEQLLSVVYRPIC